LGFSGLEWPQLRAWMGVCGGVDEGLGRGVELR